MTKAKILIGGVGFAALAAAAPSAAQYYPYHQGYGYGRINSHTAVNQCTAAVQNRLAYRGQRGYVYRNYASGRVVSVTRVTPRRGTVRVTGLATSGRMAYNRYGYGPYGIGAYGMLGQSYNQRADLRFACTVDYRGRIRDIDINRR